MEKRYLISDAAKLVNVESHVLRYWEEELEMKINRNEMGHRYYTESDINAFKVIKKLKAGGYGLKAIKEHLPEIYVTDEEKALTLEIPKNEIYGGQSPVVVESVKVEQFKQMLSDVINQALADNNLALTKDISRNVATNVIKEINYMDREKEEQAEKRFKELDETIRIYQKDREAAATVENDKRGFFRKKKKRDK